MAQGDRNKIARRYANALLAAADEKSAFAPVEQDVKALLAAIQSSPDFQEFLANPVLSAKKQLDVIKAIIAKTKFHQLTQNFLQLLCTNKRLEVLADTLVNFENLVAERNHIKTAEVVSAYALTSAQQDTLKKTLSATLGGQVLLDVKVDPSLIGGLSVKVGSLLIDDTVKRKLERLYKTLNENTDSNLSKAS